MTSLFSFLFVLLSVVQRGDRPTGVGGPPATDHWSDRPGPEPHTSPPQTGLPAAPSLWPCGSHRWPWAAACFQRRQYPGSAEHACLKYFRDCVCFKNKLWLRKTIMVSHTYLAAAIFDLERQYAFRGDSTQVVQSKHVWNTSRIGWVYKVFIDCLWRKKFMVSQVFFFLIHSVYCLPDLTIMSLWSVLCSFFFVLFFWYFNLNLFLRAAFCLFAVDLID